MVKYSTYKNGKGEKLWKYYKYAGLHPKTGKEIVLRQQGFKTRSEAKLVLEREFEKVTNNFGNKEKKDIKFKEFFETFLTFYETTGVSESTVNKFESESKKHVLPVIGDYYIRSITITDGQRLVESIRENRKDFRKVFGHARAVMDFAVHEELIKTNSFKNVILKGKKKRYASNRVARKENFYSPAELMKFLEYYEKNGNFHEFVYFRLLAFSGLRRGEALSLFKTDLKYTDKSLKINKTLAEGRGKRSTYLSYFTKTGNSDDDRESIVYLDDYTFELLDKLCHKTQYTFANNVTKEIYTSKFIFTSPRTESFYNRSAPNDWLKKFWVKHKKELNKIGLSYISPHGFRHSQATLLFELGIDAKDAQHRLRHKHLKTTMDIYTHLSEDRDKKTKNKLNDFQSSHAISPATVVNLEDYKRSKG